MKRRCKSTMYIWGYNYSNVYLFIAQQPTSNTMAYHIPLSVTPIPPFAFVKHSIYCYFHSNETALKCVYAWGHFSMESPVYDEHGRCSIRLTYF